MYRNIQRFLPLFKTSVSIDFSYRRLLSAGSNTPWFVEEQLPSSFAGRQHPPHISFKTPSLIAPAPTDAPKVLKELHAHLADSPHLDASTLILSRSILPPEGPPLPLRMPHGRRKRGGTYFGESQYDTTNGIWNWVITAQVKEGTENRGAIESVVRTVRKMLLSVEPPVQIPSKSRQQMQSGWAMIDAGNFAVHILSKEAREKYFNQQVW